MSKLITEAIFIGLLSILFLYLYNYFSYYYNNDDNIVISCISNCVTDKINKRNNIYNYKNYFIAFLFGIILHLLIDYIGINKIYCNKICYDNGKCELVCKMPLN